MGNIGLLISSSQLTGRDMGGIILITSGVALVGFGIYSVMRDRKKDRL